LEKVWITNQFVATEVLALGNWENKDKFVLALVMKRKSSKGFADYKLVKIIKHKYAIEEEEIIFQCTCAESQK
jgi:hypothetical protein